MKYDIKYESCFIEPYWNSKNNELCRHLNIEQYSFNSKDTCIEALRDILDIPDSELSEDQIQKQFSSHDFQLEPSKIIQIKDYYNGRLELFNDIVSQIPLNFENAIFPITIRKDILERHNSFSINDEDNVKQIHSFIEIVIDNRDDYLND